MISFIEPYWSSPVMGSTLCTGWDTLRMRKYRAWIGMVMPGDEASQRHAARIVLEHLP